MAGETRDHRLREALKRLALAPNDEMAWAELHGTLRPFIYAIVYRNLSGLQALSEDVTQEVFLRLLNARPFGRISEPGAFRAYVAVVAVNCARSCRARMLRQPQGASADIENVEGFSELGVGLNEAVGMLGQKDRDLLMLVSQGMSLSEISKALGVAYSTVGVRLHRLRKRLKASV